MNKDIIFDPSDNVPRTIVFCMILPSTVLFFCLLYIVLKKSPREMRNYKYVIISLSFSFYQSDVLGTLLCPTTLPGMAGVQFSGPLGYLFPRHGNMFYLIYILSIILSSLTLVFSFVWREYALAKFDRSVISITFQLVHFILLTASFSLMFNEHSQTDSDDLLVRAELDARKAPYQKNIALHGIMDSKPQYYQYLFFCFLTASLYIVKAIYRIMNVINKGGQMYSRHTLLMHKMLLRALICQMLAAFFFFVIPITLLFLPLFLNNWLIQTYGHATAMWIMWNFVAIMLSIPSFFSTTHVVSVIYFTTPYRRYLMKLIKRTRRYVQQPVDGGPSTTPC